MKTIVYDFIQRLIFTLGISALTAVALGYFDKAPHVEAPKFFEAESMPAPAPLPLNSALK